MVIVINTRCVFPVVRLGIIQRHINMPSHAAFYQCTFSGSGMSFHAV